jgi:hypothetical protein
MDLEEAERLLTQVVATFPDSQLREACAVVLKELGDLKGELNLTVQERDMAMYEGDNPR